VGKIRPGNKKNAGLNGEWGAHVGKGEKKNTSGIRRAKVKKEIKEHLDKKDDIDDATIGEVEY